MKKNPVIFICTLFAIIGVILIIAGFGVGKLMEIPEENRGRTVATISNIDRHHDSDGDTTYSVYVTYSVDGRVYKEFLNEYVSTWQEGEQLEIIYDKTKPTKIQTEAGNKIVTYVLGGLGAFFAIVGMIGLVNIVSKNKQNKKLEQSGTIIYAKLDGVEINPNVIVNGKHPYNIVCSWLNPEDNNTYIFKSENLFFDPKPVIDNMGLSEFPVFIDMENKKKYKVDTSVIEERVVDLR